MSGNLLRETRSVSFITVTCSLNKRDKKYFFSSLLSINMIFKWFRSSRQHNIFRWRNFRLFVYFDCLSKCRACYPLHVSVQEIMTTYGKKVPFACFSAHRGASKLQRTKSWNLHVCLRQCVLFCSKSVILSENNALYKSVSGQIPSSVKKRRFCSVIVVDVDGWLVSLLTVQKLPETLPKINKQTNQRLFVSLWV